MDEELGYRFWPLTITWYITDRCNLSCDFCYANYKSTWNNLEAINRTCQEVISMKPFSVGIIGGEPFISPQIFSIIEKFEKANIKVNIATNGTLLDEQMAIKLSTFNNINKIQFSLDGSNDEVNDSIRGVGTFSKVIDAIKLCKKMNINISVSTLISLKNINNILDTIKFLESIDVSEVVLAIFLPSGKGNAVSNKYFVNASKMKKTFSDISIYELQHKPKIKIIKPSFAKTLGVDFSKEDCLNIKHSYSCPAGTRKLTILPDGNVVGCEHLDNDVYGNVNKESLKKIWFNEESFKKWRNVYHINECIECESYCICRGGCRASAMLSEGGFLEKEPLCWK